MDALTFIIIFKLVFLSHAAVIPLNAASDINILDYGAVSDDTTDNSKAFLEAWKVMCRTKTANPTMIIPERKTFLVHPVHFSGPCKAKNITVLVLGEIVAPSSPGAWKGLDSSQWLVFEGITGLHLSGPGKIDGRGSDWWDQSCRDHPGLKGCTSLAPTALKLISCSESSVSRIYLTNSPQTHILIQQSTGIDINNVTIRSPEISPNTDGIHIQGSNNLKIRYAEIGSGDDCISIGDYTHKVNISHVGCGPGHGISIGSLGRSGNYVQVENIHVKSVSLNGTTNGARIKTWQVGKGYVRGVTFENFFLNKVKYPIIIDQNYCSEQGACKELKTGVQISDVTFKKFSGISSTVEGITLNCSNSVACKGIVLQSIQLIPAKSGQNITAYCKNAYGSTIGQVQPSALCLQN